MLADLRELLLTLVHYIQDPQALIGVAGMAGLTAIIFAETGLLVGFFLPGDSLLFTAGLFAARGDLNILWLGLVLNIAAVLGDAVGYAIGRGAGPLMYERKETFLFRRSHLMKAREFYEKHGGKTIILARFIPIVRTFAPTVAGVAKMPYSKFFMFNVVGGTLWIWSMLLGGFALARTIPNADKYIHYIIVAILLLSVAPLFIKWMKDRKSPSIVSPTSPKS